MVDLFVPRRKKGGIVDEFHNILSKISEESQNLDISSIVANSITMEMLTQAIEKEIRGEDTGTTIMGIKIFTSTAIPINFIAFRDQEGKIVSIVKLEE